MPSEFFICDFCHLRFSDTTVYTHKDGQRDELTSQSETHGEVPEHAHAADRACCEAVGGQTIKGSEQLAAEGVDGAPNSTQLH